MQYLFDPYPANSISGHGYSADGVRWHFSDTEPYSNVVRYADGSNHTFATLDGVDSRPQGWSSVLLLDRRTAI